MTPWASLSFTISLSLLKLMFIESVMPSNHLILCSPLLLLPSIFPSIRVLSNESTLCIRWPKYWIISFSISPSNDYSGLISFRTDWLDLLAVQGILKSLLQHHSLKASILWLSAFFIVQFSHPYMTTGKTIVLTRQTFVGKDCLCFLICCLLLLLLLNRFSCVQLCATPETAAHQAPPSMGFSRQEYWCGVPLPYPNMLSRLVIAILPRSKCLLISWLQSPPAVILEPQNKVSQFPPFPIYLS